ncbi:MAG: hypothetical protein IH831_06355, partial [Planctomycetes bacterium]|nr:hypothetical protein [Planctomycetota bacterium]
MYDAGTAQTCSCLRLNSYVLSIREAYSVNEKLALGVDGGGTKTVAWLARTTPAGELEVLGRGSAGSSNLRAVGRDKALENLSLSIDSAWSDSGREVGS